MSKILHKMRIKNRRLTELVPNACRYATFRWVVIHATCSLPYVAASTKEIRLLHVYFLTSSHCIFRVLEPFSTTFPLTTVYKEAKSRYKTAQNSYQWIVMGLGCVDIDRDGRHIMMGSHTQFSSGRAVR